MLAINISYAQEHQDNDVAIYESGVKLVKHSDYKSNLLRSSSSDVIAKVGEYDVVAGKMPNNYVVLKVPKKGPAYFIGNTIVVKCKKNKECIPSNLNAKKVNNSGKYIVTVSNYAQYQDAMVILRAQDGVKFVKPTKFYGKKVKYR